jgi:Anti-sigma-K factor rskA
VTVPHPDPERLALAALPAEPDDPDVVAHLRDCGRCSAEVDALRRTVELAREGMGEPLPEPPSHVWDAIAAAVALPAESNGKVSGVPHAVLDAMVTADAGEGRDAVAAGDPGDPRDGAAAVDSGHARPATLRRRPSRARRILIPLAAAVIGLVVGLGIGRAVNPGPGSPPVAGPVGRLSPVGDLDPGASGTVAMADDRGEQRMVVQVQGVTNIAGGDHLEAWLMDASGTRLVPLGALAGTDGDFHGSFAVPDGLPLAEFGRVDVSAERWDGNPGHSAVSVLRGDAP